MKPRMIQVSITPHNMPNSVAITFPKKLLSIFKSNHRTNEIVIIHTLDGLKIRTAVLMDNKTFKINKRGQVSYSSEFARDFIGKWNYEIDGDNIMLWDHSAADSISSK